MVARKNDPTTTATKKEQAALQRLLEINPREYRSRLHRIEAAVGRRVWATGPCHSLHPYDAEALNFSLGHEIEGRPEALPGTFEFGFDAQNHLLLSREYGDSLGFVDEELFEYAAGTASSVLWRSTPRQTSVARAGIFELIENGPTRSVEASARGAITVRSYQRDGLQRVVSFSVATRATRESAAIVRRFAVDYNQRGEMVSITEHVDTKRIVRFERIRGSSDVTFRDLYEALVREITAALTKWQGRRVYSVYLEYSRDSFDELIPPAISVNFNLPKRASKWTRWDLGDHPWRQHIELAGAHLEDTCRIARSHLRVLGSSAPAEALLDRVAKKLNEGLLEPILDVTDDFVVVPVDVERGSAGVIAAILRLAPAARVQLLRERGLLD